MGLVSAINLCDASLDAGVSKTCSTYGEIESLREHVPHSRPRSDWQSGDYCLAPIKYKGSDEESSWLPSGLLLHEPRCCESTANAQ